VLFSFRLSSVPLLPRAIVAIVVSASREAHGRQRCRLAGTIGRSNSCNRIATITRPPLAGRTPPREKKPPRPAETASTAAWFNLSLQQLGSAGLSEYWTYRRTGAAQIIEYIRFERVVHVEERAAVDSSRGGGLPAPLRFGSTRFESEPYDEDVIPGFWHLQRYRKS
jgi:hypothetical protein